MFESVLRQQWNVAGKFSQQKWTFLANLSSFWCSRRQRALLAIFSLSSLFACTHSVNVVHTDIGTNEGQVNDIFDTNVVVQWPKSSSSQQTLKGGFFAVGLHNRWDIDFSSTTPEAVADVLRQNFANVSVEQSYRKSCGGCGMIVRPQITRFGFNKLSMQATIELDLHIFDGYGQFVHTLEHKGQSPIMSLSRVGVVTAGYFVPFSSTLLGKPVVNATIKSALDDALQDIEQRFAQESQVGGKLARVWRPKKESYGNYEFAAEKVARKMGCDLSTDGINLSESLHGREVYDAFCYKPGRFKISCDLGRCDAEINSERSIVSKPELEDTLN